MSEVYNYLRDGGMILRIKPTVTNCNTLKVFPTFDVGLKHLLTVANGTGSGRYTGNELIQIIANTVNNYYFTHWNDPSSVVTDINAGTTTVTMPFLDCTVTAVILPYRTLTVNNGSGSNTQLKPGDVRQIVANAPQTGYIFNNWSGDTAYLSANTSTANITMPDQNIILTANYSGNYTQIQYGLLYNYYASTDSRIAPNGWHVPTKTDFENLIAYLGIYSGFKLKEVGTDHWESPNTGATNQTGFTAVPSGSRGYNGTYNLLHAYNYLWSSTPTEENGYAYYMVLGSVSNSALIGYNLLRTGNSIRLIKDDSDDPSVLIDIDGNVYKTITIGNQVWTAANWKCTHFNDGTLIPEITANGSWANLSTPALCAYNNDWNQV